MIRPIGPEWAGYIEQNQPYPVAMREDAATFERLLKSGHCLGEVVGELADQRRLLGWILFENDTPQHKRWRQVYCYDLAVLPDHQRKGIGRQLWIAACKELRWLGYYIRVHCRKTSYDLIANYDVGYKILIDHFLPDHYAEEYEDDSLKGEHAHELWLKPVGQ